MSEVRGSGQECQAPTAQERPRRATQVRGQGQLAGSYPMSEVRGGGREELPGEHGQGRQPRGATPRPHARGRERQQGGATLSPRPGAVAGRTNPTPEARGSGREDQPHSMHGCAGTGGYRSYPTLKVRKGGGEEIPLLHGKEQQLCFAVAAVKRYPMPKVRDTQVRW